MTPEALAALEADPRVRFDPLGSFVADRHTANDEWEQ